MDEQAQHERLTNTALYENADQRAHLTYYDLRQHLSFVWGGGPQIQVCPGGYGEAANSRLNLDAPDGWTRETVTVQQFHDFVEENLPAVRAMLAVLEAQGHA